MKKIIPLLFLMFATLLPGASGNIAEEAAGAYYEIAQRALLPDPMPVYYGAGIGMVNHSMPGTEERALPTKNIYTSSPGCYVACYSTSKNKEKSVYPVSADIYVMGQVRVSGKYQRRICRATGYETADISGLDKFKEYCNQIPACAGNNCWAGGDTGGWFGIQPDGSISTSACGLHVQKAMLKARTERSIKPPKESVEMRR